MESVSAETRSGDANASKVEKANAAVKLKQVQRWGSKALAKTSRGPAKGGSDSDPGNEMGHKISECHSARPESRH